jgi:hypothetical protein
MSISSWRTVLFQVCPAAASDNAGCSGSHRATRIKITFPSIRKGEPIPSVKRRRRTASRCRTRGENSTGSGPSGRSRTGVQPPRVTSRGRIFTDPLTRTFSLNLPTLSLVWERASENRDTECLNSRGATMGRAPVPQLFNRRAKADQERPADVATRRGTVDDHLGSRVSTLEELFGREPHQAAEILAVVVCHPQAP